MAVAVKSIPHDARLSVVEHLDELRWRVIVSAVGVIVAFGFAFWQNHALLDVLNRPLTNATATAARSGSGPAARAARLVVAQRHALEQSAAAFAQLARSPSLTAPDRAAAARAGAANRTVLHATPRDAAGRQPVTLGLAEPFTQTLSVSIYFALLFTLPLLLYQAYAFVLPAISPRERRVALPLMAMVPVLFAAGVAFGYFLVLPAAVGFLQNFNQGQFEVLVQARAYYGFTIFTLIAMGLLFQIPVAILALTRLGIVTPAQLRSNRRYAIVVISIIAVLLPGVDPVTTLIEMVPMLILYELSILLAAWATWLQDRDEPEPVS
jgi:sec-independent protein translocase protein TatC